MHRSRRRDAVVRGDGVRHANGKHNGPYDPRPGRPKGPCKTSLPDGRRCAGRNGHPPYSSSNAFYEVIDGHVYRLPA